VSVNQIELGQLIKPAKLIRAENKSFPILSMTMHAGLVEQADKFKKRVASIDTAPYKVVRRNQLVVGFPIDEGVLSFQELHDEAIVSPAYDVWDIRDERKIGTKYLERFLRSPRALAFYASKLRGTTARRRTLPDDIFLSLLVPVPPLAEQRRIADLLDRADGLRAKRSAAIRQLDRLIQTIFLDLFGDPIVNPKRWPNPTLGGLLTFQQYGPRFYDESYSPDGMRIVRITDLDEAGTLNFSEMPRLAVSEADRQKYSLREGDLIFARSGATVGKVALIKRGDPPCIAGAYFITMRFGDTVEPIYARSVLTSPSIREKVAKLSRQAAQQNFSGPGLRRLPMPLPPIELQRTFVRRVAAVDRLRGSHCAALAELDALFGALQHRAFRGEL
jgi:type I restriction enzyme, S subunit